METCFRQLERRYLVSSVGFSMKVVDRDGCRDVWPVAGKDKGGRGGGGGDDAGGGSNAPAVSDPAGRPRAAVPPKAARLGTKTRASF